MSDWVVAVVAFAVCIYPIQPFTFGTDGGGGFDAFLDRQGSLSELPDS